MSPWKQFIFCLASQNVLICSVQSTNEHSEKSVRKFITRTNIIYLHFPISLYRFTRGNSLWFAIALKLLKMFLSATSGPSDWTIINSIRKKGTVTVCQLKDCHFFVPTFSPVKTCARKCPLCPSLAAAVTDGKISSFTFSRNSSIHCLKILKPRQ